MQKLKRAGAKDIIALTTIVMFVIMKLKGVDGNLDAPLALILGYYFARRTDGNDIGI